MHLADHLDRVGQPRDGRGDEPDGDRAAEAVSEPARGLEALAHRAGVVGPGSGEHDGVAVGEPECVEALGEHLDDAVVGAELIGEPRAAAEAVEPEREPGAHVEARGEHERHDDRVGLGVGAEGGRDIRVAGVDEADGDVELGSLGRDAVDEPDHGFAVLRSTGAPWVTATRRRGCAPCSAGAPAPARPDHLPTRALRRNPVSPPISTLCTACFADGTRVFPGREECLTPPRDRCASRDGVRVSPRAARVAPGGCARPAARGARRRSRRGCPRAARAAPRGRATTAGLV